MAVMAVDRYGGFFDHHETDEEEDERPRRREFKKKAEVLGPTALAYNELARRVEHNEKRKVLGLAPEYVAEYGRGL